MKTSNSDAPDPRVFTWLGANRLLYLAPLNLVWSTEDGEKDVREFRRIAKILEGEPEYWSELIRTPSWRACLVACTCLLSMGRRSNFEDLAFRFENGSWIAPQIAVAMGLLHPEKTIILFENIRTRAVESSVAVKIDVSAYEVLRRISAKPVQEPSRSNWDALAFDDALVAATVVEEHWNFWRARIEEPNVGS